MAIVIHDVYEQFADMKTITKVSIPSWLNFYPGDRVKDVESSIGVYVDECGSKPTVHLFAVDPNPRLVPFSTSVYKVCAELVRRIKGDGCVADFHWTYTAAVGRTQFWFRKENGFVTGVTFTNSFPVERLSPVKTIEDYQKELNLLPDVASASCSSQRYDNPMHRIIIPLPKHPERHHVLDSAYKRSDTHKVVLVDSKLFMTYWLDQEKHEYDCESIEDLGRVYESQPLRGDDAPFPPFHTDVDESIKHISPYAGCPDTTTVARLHRFRVAAKPLFWRKFTSLFRPSQSEGAHIREKLFFTNGRHRALNMYMLGAPCIPITVSTRHDDHKVLEERFGWGYGG